MKKKLLDLFCTPTILDENFDFNETALSIQTKLYAYLLTQLRNTDIANDILQETLITAYHNWSGNSFECKEQIEFWLFKIAKNKMLDYFRQVQRRKVITENKVMEITYYLGWEAAPQTNIHEEPIVYNEKHNKVLHELILKLSIEQRTVVKLRFFEKLSFREISIQTKVNINTCISRFHYGIANLKKMSEDLFLKL